jgi:tetraacyldisaccharide 4'-kinase
MSARVSAKVAAAWDAGDQLWPRPVAAGLAGAYRGMVSAREWLYRRGVLRSQAVGCPVVSIGNLTVGGTGKTPAVELAVQTLKGLGHKPAVVSRGYRRRSRGVQVVADAASIRLEGEDAGDEPFLLARRLPGVPVVVGANRAEAVKLARDRFDVTAIVLDDGFQHRTLRKDLEIVMARARRPWGNGRLFPRGMLREPLSALARADFIVLTNPPSSTAAAAAADTIRQHNARAPIMVAHYQVLGARTMPAGREITPTELHGRRLLDFAGLGSPRGFTNTLTAAGVDVAGLVEYPDHYWFDQRDLTELAQHAVSVGADGLITTEKDWVRLKSLSPPPGILYVLRVRLALDAGRELLVHALEGLLASTPSRR